MADMQRPSLVERDIDQAITALKKGAHLLKYGRRGKPKFCPFRLSADESTLIWYYGKDEKKQLELRHVSRIIPGQRTSIFHRYPRPEKEYQSFSLIYNDRSLDLICKDKDEAEVWFVGLKALIARGSNRKQRNESRSENAFPESPRGRKSTPSKSSDQGSTKPRQENTSQGRLGKAFSDVLSHTAKTKNPQLLVLDHKSYPPPSLQSNTPTESFIPRTSSVDNTIRISLSSAVSSSSQGSGIEDLDNLGDIFIWGEGLSRATQPSNTSIPKVVESTVVLDVHRVACGRRHASLVTKQGELFTWGEEESGRLGHGVDSDISHPKLVQTLGEKNIGMVACGERHTCAVTVSGDLYACGLLGAGSKWVPKRVGGLIDGLQVSFVSCGPWHTAVVTSFGKLFTFGDGTFGALGHGDRSGSDVPREVEGLKGLKTVRVACGVWHTAAIVDVASDSEVSVSGGKLFTWGDADKGKLGHGDTMPRLAPECIASLVDLSFSQVVCGNNLTVALTISGRVYTIGQQGNSSADKNIVCVRGNIIDSVDEISCGSHHIAVLTSKSEVYTWGKGSNGQLGHGDMEDKSSPTIVDSLKDKQVKSISCGSNFTAAVCLRKWISTADNSVCSGCHNQFNFMRKRHNCYNCGLVFCKTCSSKKSLRASMAPSESKLYRVCDECFVKLQKVGDGVSVRVSNVKMGASKSVEASRMSSVDSFKMDRSSAKFDSGIRDVSSKRQSVSSKSPTSPFGASQNFLSFFVPDSRRHSRSPSPIPAKTLSPAVTPPFRLSEANLDDLKVGGEGLSSEVKSLRKQVENLTSKSQVLEADLEMKRKQLKEILAQASDEAEKSKAAEEVIKTLTLQLKEMSESDVANLDLNEQMGNDPDRPSNVSSVASPKSDSGDNPNPAQLHKSKKSKRIVQDEPGVYITLVTLPNGVNELRRVRFSRKRFTEEQAEKWWAENRTSACARHNVRVTQ